MKKINTILYIVDGLGPAAARGVEIIYENIKIISQLGFRVIVLTTKDAQTNLQSWNEWKENQSRNGIEVVGTDVHYNFFPVLWGVAFAKIINFFRAVQILHKAKIDIIHEYSSSPLFYLRTALIAKIGKCKSIHTIVTANTTLLSAGWLAILGKFLDVCIFTSDQFAGKFKQMIDSSKISIIPLGVDLERFKKAPSRRSVYGLTNKQVTVLYLGPPETNKGVFLLARVAKRILEKKDISFLFVLYRKFSLNTYKEGLIKLKSIIKEDERMQIIENLVDVPSLMQSVDIVVTPQLTPHGTLVQPQTLLEAMAAGKVIVAPSTPELAELISDHVDGYLFEQGNVDSLENALLDSINNLPKKIGEKAQNKIRQKYDLEKNAKKLGLLYQQLLES